VRAIDNFSGSASYWGTAATQAMTSWSVANGPQHGVVSWSSQSNDTWDYFNYSTTGSNGLPNNNTLGITWNYDPFGNPYYTSVAIVTWWSDIYANGIPLINSSTSPIPFETQWTFAHEFGHSLGLSDETNSLHLMNASASPYLVNGPMDPGDLGAMPICPASTADWGIRCIYDWSIN
jgi:hypothetical protein